MNEIKNKKNQKTEMQSPKTNFKTFKMNDDVHLEG